MIHVCPECGERYQGPGACPRDGHALIASDDPLLGQQIGSWRVTQLLGVGGMGRVYKGVQPSIGARVAIKVLAVEGSSDPTLVDRFFAEARAVNVIRHEQIVNIMDLSRLPDGRPYIVMEYLDGASLAGVLRARGRLPLGSMARLVAEVLDALHAAHARNIVHRDLKPDNIWVTVAGHAKVLDFGIAKLDPGLGGGQQRTKAGSIMGTPPYMSPEQAMAKAVDLRSDLYSMGIILYECATGKVPFDADALFEILRMHLQTPPAPPRMARPDMPPEMENVILRALAKDPAQRFPDAPSMAQALLASAATLPAEEWAELRQSSGVNLPPLPSGGGIITPFGPRVPSSPAHLHSNLSIAHGPTMAQPRSRLPLVLGGLIAVALAGGGLAAGLLLRGGGGGASPAPVVAPVNPTESQAKVTAMLAGGGAPDAAATAVAVIEEPHINVVERPPAPSADPAPLSDPASFDAIGYLPEAQRLARARLENAELTEMIVQHVRADGSANLTEDGYPFVKYGFRSVTASQRGDTPPGQELNCLIQVFATSYQGVKVEPRSDEKCEDKIIGWPHCSLAQVWAKAVEDGAPSDGMATLQWMTDFNGKTHWLFTMGSEHLKWIDDDCTGQ